MSDAALQDDAATIAAQAAVDALAAAEPKEPVADPAPVVPAAPVVPDKYDIKLPDGVTDAAIVERTAAIARELGLGNEAAQKLLDREVATLTEQQTAQTALVEAWKPGGAEFVKRDAQWTADAKADKEIGGENFPAALEKAQLALTKYGPELKTYLDQTGLGSHPAAIKFLANVGKAMSEGGLVLGKIGGAPKAKSDAETLYPQHYQSAS